MGDNKQKYKCSECESLFPSDSSLRYHIEKDHQNIRWSCDKCDKVLFTKSGLREHVRSAHEKMRFKCDICGVTNRTERAIRKHKTTVHDKITRYSCQHENCGFKSYDQASLNNHVKMVHEGNKKKDKCKICGKEFSSMSWHMAKVHTDIRHSCNQCEKSYITRTHLDEHITRFHGAKNLKCPEEKCLYRTSFNKYLEKHINYMHKEQKPSFSCTYCNHKSTSKSGLQRHITFKHLKPSKQNCDICQKPVRSIEKHKLRKHSEIRPNTFQCDKCEKSFPELGYLRSHKIRHKGINYYCEHCGMKFMSISGRQSHIERIHEKTLKFTKCTECDYSTQYPGHIIRHFERLHTDNRQKIPCSKCAYVAKSDRDIKIHIDAVHEKIRIKCDLCEKDFARRPALYLHKQKVHKGVDKSEQCSICDKKLSSKSKLKRHISDIHLKLKPFECPTCEYKATAKEMLNNHIKAIHEGVKFKCSYCDYKTSFKSNVGKHEESAHSGKQFQCEFCSYSTTHRQTLANHRKAKHTENNKV